MSVFVGSRYQGCKFTGILGKDGKVRRFLHAREPLALGQMKNPVTVHEFQFGESLDGLAWMAAGKPRLWWMIGDINGILFPLDIESGTRLVIPMRDLKDRQEIG